MIYRKLLASLIIFMTASNTNVLTDLDAAYRLQKDNKKPILLIFGADYCGYCEKLKSDIQNIVINKKPIHEIYNICYIDIQQHRLLKRRYGVSSIPDSRIIINKTEQDKIIGYNKQKYIDWILNNQ